MICSFYHQTYPSLSKSHESHLGGGRKQQQRISFADGETEGKLGHSKKGNPVHGPLHPSNNFDTNIDTTPVQITCRLFYPPVCMLLCLWSVPEKKKRTALQDSKILVLCPMFCTVGKFSVEDFLLTTS